MVRDTKQEMAVIAAVCNVCACVIVYVCVCFKAFS